MSEKEGMDAIQKMVWKLALMVWTWRRSLPLKWLLREAQLNKRLRSLAIFVISWDDLPETNAVTWHKWRRANINSIFYSEVIPENHVFVTKSVPIKDLGLFIPPSCTES